MHRWWGCVGCLLLAEAVALGAWSAHGLGEHLAGFYLGGEAQEAGHTIPLATKRLHDFKTAVQYHMWHAVGLMCLTIVGARRRSWWLTLACGLHVLGIVLFSHVLYVLVLTARTELGMVAPVGGFSFIVGWLCAAIGWASLPSPDAASPDLVD